MEFQDKNNNPIAPYATRNRDLSTIPVLWKWAAQGKVFEAGAGMEDSAIAALAAVNDQTASFALVAPSGTSTLIVPILIRASMAVDGNALTQLSLSFTKPQGLLGTIATIATGTAFTSKHCVYKTGGAVKAAQTASALYTCTTAVLVAADYVEYERRIAVDALLTTGLVNFGNGPSNVYEKLLLTPSEIHIMTASAAMLVSVINSTTDATFKPYMMWAELTEDDLL